MPVKPVKHRQVGLADPAVAPHALHEHAKAVELHEIADHVDVVVQPYHVEIIEGILHAAPLAVLVKSGLILVEVAQTALAVGLAIPEVAGKLGIIKVLEIDILEFGNFFDCL